MNTRTTRRRVSYKWIEICRNSLVTICNFELRSRSMSTTFAIVSFDGIYQHLWRSYVFALALTVSEILTFEIFTLKKYIKSNAVLITQWRHSMAKKSISTKAMLHFLCASSHHFRDINIWNSWPLKSRSRSLKTTFAITLIDDKNQHILTLGIA